MARSDVVQVLLVFVTDKMWMVVGLRIQFYYYRLFPIHESVSIRLERSGSNCVCFVAHTKFSYVPDSGNGIRCHSVKMYCIHTKDIYIVVQYGEETLI
jgi:hypothetical protein